MTRILLIYPFFKPRHDRSSFRFPPLGLGYLASSLKVSGYRPAILDCTFLEWDEARAKAVDTKADIVGIYSMVTMHEEGMMFAKLLKNRAIFLLPAAPCRLATRAPSWTTATLWLWAKASKQF